MKSGEMLVVIKGAGDLGSGVGWLLHRSGYRVVMTETPAPTAVRRRVAFAEAVYEGKAAVQGVEAVLARGPEEIEPLLAQGRIAVVVDPEAAVVSSLRPAVVVDAVMAKANRGTRMTEAPLVIGLGPGFVAGRDVHVVVETQRGPRLGQPLFRGSAEADTGVPAPVGGESDWRVLRAPVAGRVEVSREIGDAVRVGEVVLRVASVPVEAGLSGVIRGLLRPGIWAEHGQKLGDIDPRGRRELCFQISDKALAVAAGVLRAMRASAGSPLDGGDPSRLPPGR